MCRRIPIYPILIALFPILSVWSSNAYEALAAEAMICLGVVFSAALAWWLLLWLATRDRHIGGMIAGLSFIVFYTYRYVYFAIIDVSLMGLEVGRHRYLAGASLIILIAIYVAARRSRRDLSRFSGAANLILAVIVLVPIATIGFKSLPAAGVTGLSDQPDLNPESLTLPDQLPDIYHIILDAYGRHDVYKRIYDYDNGEFLEGLRQRGFFVAEESTANYPCTTHSLTSMLHMSYLDELAERYGENSSDPRPIFHLLNRNPVRQTLRRLGYKEVAFITGVDWSQFTDADLYLEPERRIGNFTSLLIAMSPWEVLANTEQLLARLGVISNDAQYRLRVRYVLNELPRVATIQGPKYVFAHIICPHNPFLFDAQGRDRPNLDWEALRIAERREKGERITEFIEPLREQVKFISRRVLEVIDEILARNPTPPIIILNGDHGPESQLGGFHIDRIDHSERFPILNAYLLPGDANGSLYHQITPVNSYRIIFNRYFGTDFPMLPDKNILTSGEQPFLYHDVTDRVQASP